MMAYLSGCDKIVIIDCDKIDNIQIAFLSLVPVIETTASIFCMKLYGS